MGPSSRTPIDRGGSRCRARGATHSQKNLSLSKLAREPSSMQLCSLGSLPHPSPNQTFLPMLPARFYPRKVVTCGQKTTGAPIRNPPTRIGTRKIALTRPIEPLLMCDSRGRPIKQTAIGRKEARSYLMTVPQPRTTSTLPLGSFLNVSQVWLQTMRREGICGLS
jgi:hypothetical protein